MFKKSRKKIVAAIMSVLALLLVGTVSVIYLSSYFEMRLDNYRMLEQQIQMYSLRVDNVNLQPGGMGSMINKKPSFELSTFYSVVIGDDGRILATDVADRQLYDEVWLQSCAAEIIHSGKKRGIKGNLLYMTGYKQGYTVVMFMDNTIVEERITSLLRNTLIFGGASMAALFFLARYLARRIVAPLEESYQKQKQFISDAGHELKTPVSVVSTNAEMLCREIGENQWLSNIQYENERMGLLVRQLLELARTENVRLQMERTDLSRLVAGEALPFETVAFEKGLTLCTDIQPGLMVTGDGAQLRQLISILLDNGIEHSESGQEVTVRLCTDHNMAKISVINEGKEIPKDQQEQIFERFYRADTARSDSGHFGLGLAIAKAVAETHKGKIAVECYGGKVEFTVSLPLSK